MFDLLHAIIDKLSVHQGEKDELHAKVNEAAEPAKEESENGNG
jgi:uncharacterized protein YjbJ (UPF0337 family)